MNDYRTLLLHIPQQNVDAPPEDYWEEGYVVIRECLTAAQRLMSSNYCPSSSTASSSNDQEAEKAEFRGVILDAAARRFQAHKIYLRAAAAKRWALNRSNILRGQRPTPVHAAQLNAVSSTFRQELAQITDQYVVSDLRAADLRAGHWLDDDPSLDAINRWIQQHPRLV
ncbi:hypothetical protein PHISP_03214 [Aspergillus sp. HF37]|nr:hypothetical protein PHISP_03214 [Aspergillus sp. HF37]